MGTKKTFKIKLMIFVIFTLIVFNLLHSPIHASHDKPVRFSKETFSGEQELSSSSPTKFNISLSKFPQTKEDASNSSISRLFSYRGKDLTEAPPIISQKDVKSIWLIRHGEKDWVKTKYYLDHFKERNYEWALSEAGLIQSRRVAKVLKEQYENATTPPLIFVSPFRRTIQTALHVAYQVNSKMQIEEGLIEKHHGLWGRTAMLDYFSKYLKFFDMDYKSKFYATKEMTSPIRASDNATRSEAWEKDIIFDKNLANYFLKMLQKGKQDIIIIGHQTEIYNIQRIITGLHRHSQSAFDKIGYASMFQYVPLPKSSKLELKSYYLKGFKIPDLL